MISRIVNIRPRVQAVGSIMGPTNLSFLPFTTGTLSWRWKWGRSTFLTDADLQLPDPGWGRGATRQAGLLPMTRLMAPPYPHPSLFTSSRHAPCLYYSHRRGSSATWLWMRGRSYPAGWPARTAAPWPSCRAARTSFRACTTTSTSCLHMRGLWTSPYLNAWGWPACGSIFKP